MPLHESLPPQQKPLSPTTISPSAIQGWLVTHIAASCDVPEDEIDVQEQLTNFGLESLTLFTLAGDLATWLDRDIPATLLWEYPTIEEVANYLAHNSPSQTEDAPEAPRHNALVTIQPQGKSEAAPLFLVHDVSGALWCYTALMRHMDTEQPVYGFQIPLAHNQSDPISVPPMEELAALYVDELRRKHPQGPYRLGGFSLGGVIAFEMARQLQSAGQAVALLALMDTNHPHLKHADPPMRHMTLIHLRNLWRLGRREKVLYLLERRAPALLRSFYFHARHLEPLGAKGKMHYLQNLLARRPNAESRGTANDQQRFREALLGSDVRTQLQQAAINYTPRPYEGIITLLRARWQLTRDDDRRAWSRVALKGTRQLLSSGSHGIIITEPHVRELAANLQQCLHETQSH